MWAVWAPVGGQQGLCVDIVPALSDGFSVFILVLLCFSEHCHFMTAHPLPYGLVLIAPL